MRRSRFIFAAVLIVGLLAAGELGRRAMVTRAAVIASLPAQPELGALPAELGERMRAAEARARGFFRPVEGLAELSRLYHANGFFDAANTTYDGLRSLQPAEARWPHLQANIQATYGLLDEAEPRFRDAVRLAPEYAAARLRWGDVLLKTNRPAEAAAVYAGRLAASPQDAHALLGLARCAIATGDWTQARDRLLTAVGAHPDFFSGHSLLATVYEHLGDEPRASAARAEAGRREFLDLDDPWLTALNEDCYDAYRLSVAAAVAMVRGDHATAERWLQRAIAFAPRPAAYHRQLGKFQARLKNFDAARRSLEQATMLEPTDADAWALLVNVLNTTGDRAAAYRTVAAALTHRPDSPALHYAFGRMLNQDGNPGRALSELNQAKRLQPSDAGPYVELAAVHFRLGETEAALEELRAALKVQPDHPDALTVLAGYAIEADDAALAANLIGRARRQIRIDPRILETLQRDYQQRFGRAP